MPVSKTFRDNNKNRKQGELIRAPEQARSRETMDNILMAMEELLSEKSFDKITIQEIAQRADTGVSSIYARFRDKQTLVLGLHSQVREKSYDCLEKLSDPERWTNNSIEEIVETVVPHCVRFYRKQSAMLRAALRIDLPEMRERQATVLKYATERFSAIFAQRFPQKTKAIGLAVDDAVRLLAATMYTSLLFENLDKDQGLFSNDKANIRLLNTAIIALINSAINED